MEDKYNQLKLVSNPDKVFKKLMNDGYSIGISTRKNKKYMVLNPNNKWVHFGDSRYEDYLFHQDEKRRDLFLKRNWRWASADDYTPAYLSYHYLW
jgi:hypothetical protein